MHTLLRVTPSKICMHAYNVSSSRHTECRQFWIAPLSSVIIVVVDGYIVLNPKVNQPPSEDMYIMLAFLFQKVC